MPLSDPQHATFAATELPVVLSHYDLGVIESITVFRRGSRRSPKVGIVAQRGKFLLKRRAADRAHHQRVAFAHNVQRLLTAAGFPAPRLIPTATDGATFVECQDGVYELFAFVAGEPFQRTPRQAHEAGRTLGAFHRATAGFPAALPAPRGDYHDAAAIRTGLCAIGSNLKSHDSFTGDEAELASLVQCLLEAYDCASDAVNRLGYATLPARIIHSDWHPGNMLYRRDRIVAVFDYDSVRMAPRVVDVANAALQFAMVASGDPDTWPDHVDEDRFTAFLAGYESLDELLPHELDSIPHLMAEALVAECVPPITETGSVGRHSGFRVLQMVRRKTAWLTAHGDHLVAAARP